VNITKVYPLINYEHKTKMRDNVKVKEEIKKKNPTPYEEMWKNVLKQRLIISVGSLEVH